MLLVLFAITAGLIGGYTRHGLVANMAKVKPLFPIAAGLAAIAYVAARLFQPGGESLGLTFAVAASFALIVLLIANYTIAGSGIVATGLSLNLLVTVANGYIPVNTSVLTDLNPLQQVEATSTRLAFLGNRIPVPVFDVLVSYGDLIILAGLIVVVANATLDPNRRAKPAQDLLGLDLAGEPTLTPNPVGPSASEAPSLTPTSRPPVARSQSESDLAWNDSGQSEGVFRRIDLTGDQSDVLVNADLSESSGGSTTESGDSDSYAPQHDDGGLSVDELFGDFDNTLSSISGTIDLRTDAPAPESPDRIDAS